MGTMSGAGGPVLHSPAPRLLARPDRCLTDGRFRRPRLAVRPQIGPGLRPAGSTHPRPLPARGLAPPAPPAPDAPGSPPPHHPTRGPIAAVRQRPDPPIRGIRTIRGPNPGPSSTTDFTDHTDRGLGSGRRPVHPLIRDSSRIR